ncbi:hypothetical protein SAMN02910301_2092 [Lachnospiraceae bacterium XBD2001]|nr:hypothetical protein SAMN02910301_2092 [Lachnospiraceae bacterium XBD2001]
MHSLTPRDGVSGSLYPYKYNEPLTPSRGVIFFIFFATFFLVPGYYLYREVDAMPQELSEMRRSLYQLQARLKELFLDRKNQAEKYQSFAASLQEME